VIQGIKRMDWKVARRSRDRIDGLGSVSRA
ncbi:hypothetical protein Tco_1332476, partial [Tanacetum coccineum]